MDRTAIGVKHRVWKLAHAQQFLAPSGDVHVEVGCADEFLARVAIAMVDGGGDPYRHVETVSHFTYGEHKVTVVRHDERGVEVPVEGVGIASTTRDSRQNPSLPSDLLHTCRSHPYEGA